MTGASGGLRQLDTFKTRIREQTCRTRGLSLTQIVEELARYLIGWRRYFGFCQTPRGAHQPGGVDPPKIALVSLAAVGEWAQPLQRTAPPWRIAVQGSGCRRFTDRILAHVRTSGRPSGPAQPLLRLNRSPPTLCSGVGLSRSNRRGTRPVRPVVWEGRHREVPPYPDQPASIHQPRARPRWRVFACSIS